MTKDQIVSNHQKRLEHLSGARILLVEDNETDRTLTAGLLGMMGLQVEVCPDGEKAVAQIEQSLKDRRQVCHAVLMDIEMPVMDGYTATRIIRSHPLFQDLPIIAMTAHVHEGIRRKCLDAGMNGYLAKPLDERQLCKVLAQFTQPRRPNRQPRPAMEQTIGHETWDEMPEHIPGIDLRLSLERVGGNAGLLKKVLKSFLEQFSGADQRMRQLLAQGHTSQAEQLAHKIKGIAGNIAAQELLTASRELERMLRAGPSSESTPEMDAFIQSHRRVIDALAGLDLDQLENAPSPAQTDGSLEKDRILVVDDNPESIWSLIEHLEPHYEVIYANGARKALALASSSHRPDLILLDVMMPEMDGYQVFAKLRDGPDTRDIPVIFITARTEDQDEVKGLEIGAQDYIAKPFSLPVVKARIKSVLGLKKELKRRLSLKAELEEMNLELERQVRTKMMELDETREALLAFEEKYNYLFKAAPAMPSSRTVLVVDDNPDTIHELMEALHGDYRVTYATTGRKALQIASSEERPDVILLDIMMPEMDGYEVCSRLKASAETREIPIIFIAAHDRQVNETKGLNLGAVDFIIKPFRLPVVKARLTAALRLKEAMDNRIVLTRKLEDLNKNLETRVREKTIVLQQAHDELMASERRYRTIYEAAIEGIFEVTPQGRLLSASPSLAKILGYESPLELITSIENVTEQLYVQPEDRVRFRNLLEQNGEILNFETRFRRKQGDTIRVMICAKVVRNQSRSQRYYQGFLIDITDLKKSPVKRQ
jgi:PAS domain S-box-containing protein